MREPYPYNDLPPFEEGSDTSKEAAESMQEFSGPLRQRVYDTLVRLGRLGATDDELEEIMGLRHQTLSARRRELELMGLITKTTQRRRTRSGRTAAIYLPSDVVKESLERRGRNDPG